MRCRGIGGRALFKVRDFLGQEGVVTGLGVMAKASTGVSYSSYSKGWTQGVSERNLPDPRHNNLMERVEYSVETKASRELVWKTFSNWQIWPLFSDIYENIRWVQGQPWKPGSRLEIKLVRPVPMVVDHVILACSPPEHVAWIDHAMGTTMEQWVVFDALRAGGTRVRTWAEFTGIMPIIAGRPVKDCIRDFITGWYGKFADACDRQAE